MTPRNAPILLSALVACACAAPRPPAPAALPASTVSVIPIDSLTPTELLTRWRAASPTARAQIESELVARLQTEASHRVHPSGGFVDDRASVQADAILDEVAPAARGALARAHVAWLIERAWSVHDVRPRMRRAVAALGAVAYDMVADACERDPDAYGLPSVMLYVDEASRDALLARLLPRARAVFESAREAASDSAALDPVRERFARRVELLHALDRPEPVARFLLDALGDASVPARMRIEALSRMTRTDLPFVGPVLLALAARRDEGSVRVQIIALLGRMNVRVTPAQLAALYERTPRGADATPLRVQLGASLLGRGWPEARRWIIAWTTRRDALRAGRDEVDGWAHSLAGCSPVPEALWSDPRPEARALAILVWSWARVETDTVHVRALVSDHASLVGPGWGSADATTVGVVAREALAQPERDSGIRIECCCHGP